MVVEGFGRGAPAQDLPWPGIEDVGDCCEAGGGVPAQVRSFREVLAQKVLYNPATMQVRRYRYRGTRIATPFNIDSLDPAGARFRRTSHDDTAFVGQVSELVT